MRYWSLSFLVLLGFNLFVWFAVITGAVTELNLYFLKVGQGDSELIVLPDGVKILIDGGPDKSVLFSLVNAIPSTNRYIDLLIMTHPQTDHFAGFADVIERYKVGAFIATGKEGENETWDNFEKLLTEKNIPIILISAGGKIRYKDNLITVLAPNEELMKSKELNDTSLVLKLESEGIKALFTGDIGFTTESDLLNNNRLTSDVNQLDVDVLKVGHHGSKFSTGANFLAATTPLISIIEVGKNRYGHPTEATLNRLKQFGSQIYRTDENGTVRLRAKDGMIVIYPETQ